MKVAVPPSMNSIAMSSSWSSEIRFSAEELLYAMPFHTMPTAKINGMDKKLFSRNGHNHAGISQ
jgi:hypothetical protein